MYGVSRWKGRLAADQPANTGLFCDPEFLSQPDHRAIVTWLETIRPLWELRFPEGRPPPNGQPQRRLLRPVYWLGSWQFACLDYYRPPRFVAGRCVRAEPFPPVLQTVAQRIEALARVRYRGKDLPQGWAMNTCLVNLYGRRREGDRWLDSARVGEHRDFEPGPVASLSLGERALFQFVTSKRPGERDGVVAQQWLDDGSLQMFGGERWKKRTMHRVQRVDTRGGHRFKLQVSEFETRRVNFTFRYVPPEHVSRFCELPDAARRDVEGYVAALASSSPFFARELAAAQERGRAL